MEDRLNINEITPETSDWTCKVQLIEKARARQSKDGRIRFQIAVVQDETEEQVAVVLYGDDIEKYERKTFTPFCTYLITMAKVREPLPYGIPVNRYEWVLDRGTVVEPITEDNTEDPPLPTPTRLNIVSLATLDQQPRNVEFNILAVVVSCGTMKHAGGQGNKCRQIIVVDTNMRPCIFTLWEDFAEIDGRKLAEQIDKHPIILAKRITRSSYAGMSLTTRYSSVILINPSYQQAAELMNWVKDNEEMLSTYTQRSSSEAASTPVLLPLLDDIVPIADIPSQPIMQSFHVEGRMLLLDNANQFFYELICSNCKHFVRTKIKKDVTCVNCDVRAMLAPRCRFEVEISDGSGSTVAILLGESGENILSMKAEEIYDITKIKKEPLPLQPIQQRLANKVFKVQLKKSPSRTPDETPARLFVLSCVEKQNTLQFPAPSTSANAGESSKGKLGNVSSTHEEQDELMVESTSSSKRQHTESTTQIGKAASASRKLDIEPVTPIKKK